MEKVTTAAEYIEKHPEWKRELVQLRDLLCATELVETIKWSIPTYTINGKNVLGIGAFKGYVGLWFFQGIFLKDEQNVLINAQEGKTKGMRQWRFNSLDEINGELISQYVLEAIDNQKAGKEVKPAKQPLIIPDELRAEFQRDPLLADKFEALKLTLKREYAEHISEAKREATKLSRLEKIRPMILEGVGLNDKYR